MPFLANKIIPSSYMNTDLAVRKFYKQNSQNKFMRKLTPFSIVVCFFCFTACSKSNSSSPIQRPNTPSSTPPPTNSLDSGLIAYYPFDGNANDLSGNKFNLTVQGATLINDRSGSANKAYHFDDSTSVMKVPQFTGTDSLVTFSVSVWIKTAKEGYIYALYVPSFPTFEGIYVNKDSVTGQFTITCYVAKLYPTGGGSSYVSFQNTISDISNVWTHLVLVQDSRGLYFYVNGIKALNNPQTPLIAYFAGGGLIGALYDSQTLGHYGGDLDDLRFYKRALSEAEIKKLHDQ